MIRKMNCPDCKKGLYATDFDVYGPCPYCGFVFNWKLSDDQSVAVEVKDNENNTEAELVKVSNQK